MGQRRDAVDELLTARDEKLFNACAQASDRLHTAARHGHDPDDTLRPLADEVAQRLLAALLHARTHFLADWRVHDCAIKVTPLHSCK